MGSRAFPRVLVDAVRGGRQSGGLTLSGDRDLEWTFVAARLGRHVRQGMRVLDFGCGSGFLSYTAAELGGQVLAIDLMPRQFRPHPAVEFQQMDVEDLAPGHRFDFVINCSTIEHVGLGGRYNSKDAADGDLRAMVRLQTVLAPAGYMALTLPVGRDYTFRPLHRVYGCERLPRLLEGYEVVEETYWQKAEDDRWKPCSWKEALDDIPTEQYYSLGMMLLRTHIQ